MSGYLKFLMLFALAFAVSAGANVATDNVDEVERFATLPFIRTVNVSPDGKHLAVIRSTSKNGDYVIEIYDANNLKQAPVTLGANKMLVSSVTWLNDQRIAVNFRQILEDRAHRFWVSKLAITSIDGKSDWLVPFSKNTRAGFQLLDVLADDPQHVLVYGDANDNYIPDVITLNVDTGSSAIVLRGSDKINGGFMTDHTGQVRVGQGWNLANNTIDIYVRKSASDEWLLLKEVTATSRENYSVVGFNKSNLNQLYVLMNYGEDTVGLYQYDIDKGVYSDRLYGLENVDIDAVQFNKQHELISFSYTEKQPVSYFIDKQEAALNQQLYQLFPRQYVRISSRSVNNDVLVVSVSADKNPGEYYLLNRGGQLQKIGPTRPLLTEEMLSSVKYIAYEARDGKKIRAYVTVPSTGKAPYPTVVLPHGGPWARDVVVFDEWSQLLAHHGFLVVQANFRGSTGYGLDFWKAGDKNWGLKMQDDLDDAAEFLVEKGLADRNKLAMFGWSYGGYAAFAASMRTPNIYQCTIAGAGVSDLSRINATLNDSRYLSLLQEPTIKGVSPIEQVQHVNVPIMVVHGDIDSRVPIEHSRAFVKKLKDFHKDYQYIELKDADHFSDTLFYDHKVELYNGILSWLDNKCGFKS
ncbi:prolyl oligopeptidase family serine peptidase [Shewanella sp. C32]|uniref:Prolyl oligopeptidase family serine peptidase n=1 Tax=Shewanella electrica TaxID=515560 RepID=A0ABT2FHX8_9GAMM|nr:prolyl oligopeptidase family serine peptidase [Shewanella electrica]MCH1924037.1 prolyl oligopeptidase family serine peptidase [Shewanella electrica]MCS4555940.1 prolyl oligopeptidase family serine peptidase [Shewanella electrica]